MIGRPMIRSWGRPALPSTNCRPMTVYFWVRSALHSTNCRPMMIRSIRALIRTKGITRIPYSKRDPLLPLDRTTLCVDQTIPLKKWTEHQAPKCLCIAVEGIRRRPGEGTRATYKVLG